MRNAVKYIGAVVSRILFIGLSVQVVLGLLWMCCSFDGVQEFRASGYYLEAADSLLCDEYTGILYPFILMLVKWLGESVRVSYASIMYLLQIALAFVAGYYFVSSTGVKEKFWKLWGSLVLLTFPMTMQCHMALLPNSMAYSCFLLLLAGVAELYVQPYICWILAALLLPEYLYLGAVPVVLLVIYYIIGSLRGAKEQPVTMGSDLGIQRRGIRGHAIIYHLALMVVSVGLIAGVNALTLVPGSQGRVHNSVEAVAFRRCCWTDFSSTYYYWPEELRAAVSDDLLAEIVKEAENLDYYFMPKAEEVMGAEAAEEWFGMVAKGLFAKNYKLILYETAIDAVGYTVPTVLTDILLGGKDYSSYGMRNYEIMRQDHPLLTRYYMDYSIWWFYVGFALAAGLTVLRALVALLCGRRQQKSYARECEPEGLRCRVRVGAVKGGFSLCVCIFGAAAMVAWYALQNTGLWDYKNALFVGGLWMLWMIKGAYAGTREK